jgi:REP element-mobilizing transposase RayT
MPQSLSCLLVHLVFSTKNRQRFIDERIENELHRYVAAILRDLDCPARTVGGTVDHIHVLSSMSRTETVARVVEKAKAGSSKWIKTKGPAYKEFFWQSGYGAFSIGQSGETALREYIAQQKAHHHKVSFQDEYRALLKKYNVPYDERYVWD